MTGRGKHALGEDRAPTFSARAFGAGSTRLKSRTIAFWVVVLALYLGTSLVVTYPLVRELGRALPGGPGDGGLYLWCMDTFWTELRAGSNPFFTSRVFFPLGVNLAHSACTPFLSLLALPMLSHLVLYADVIAIVSLVGAAVGMLLLVRALTGDDQAAAVAGLLYGFSPPLLTLLWVSQFHEVAAAALMPFGILCLVKFLRNARIGPLVGMSLVAWAILFTFVYTAVAFLVMAVIVAASVARRISSKHLRRAALVGAANVLLALALLTWVLRPDDARDLPRGGHTFTSRANANLADVLVPSEHNPLLGGLHAWAFDPNNGDVPSYFVGWGILLVALVALWRRRRDPEILGLAVAGAVVLVLACGTAIRLGKIELLTLDWTPFSWLARLPFLDLLDAPRRLIVGLALAVATLAGVGLATLAAGGRRRLVLLIGLGLFALEYGQLEIAVTAVRVPIVYRVLGTFPDRRTVLELGGGLAASNAFLGLDFSTPSGDLAYWQTIHGKPRIGGYVSRIPWATLNWFAQAPIMGDLLAMAQQGKGKWPGTRYSPEDVSRFIEIFNLGYVIIPPHPRQPEYAEVLETLLVGRIAQKEMLEGYVLYTLAGADSSHSTRWPNLSPADPRS